jgi:SAM-dependent methyltransferase
MRDDFEDRYRKRKAEGKPGWTDEYESKVAELEKLLKADYAPQSGRLLELGCGAGNLTLWLAERGFEAYGMDCAPTAIAWAQDNARAQNLKADFRVGDVVELEGYPSDFFEFVLDGGCFHYITGQDRKRFLASVHRVLKSSGFFRVSTTYGNQDVKTRLEVSPGCWYDPQSRCLLKDGRPHARVGLAEDILDEIRTSGFRILCWETSERKDEKQPFVQGGLTVDAVKL